MDTSDLNKRFDELMRTFEEFKKRNDAELAEMKKGNDVPEDIKATTERHNQAIDEIQTKMEEIVTAMNRTDRNGSADTKDADAEFCRKAVDKWFRSGGRTHSKDDADIFHRHYGDRYTQVPEIKQMTAGEDTEGGYFVRPEQADKILTRIYESSPVRQFAESVTIGSGSIKFPVDWDDVTVSSVAETGTRSAMSGPSVKEITIPAHEMYAMPKLTQTMIEDAFFDIEAWVNAKVADAMRRKEATWFISGDGVTEAKGILSYTDGTGYDQLEQVASGSDGAFTGDGLIDLQNALHEDFQANARFMMNRTSAGAIRKLKNGSGDYLWATEKDLKTGFMNYLLGKPVHFATDVPVASSGSLSAIYGDFKSYLIVDRIGIRQLRDPYSSKPYILIMTSKRVGGAVQNWDGLKIQDLSAS